MLLDAVCVSISPLFHPPRAFYSLRKCGIEADDVRMAVCVMRVVPARYAFVIHTKNPSNNDANEVRGGVGVGCLWGVGGFKGRGGGVVAGSGWKVLVAGRSPPAPEHALAGKSSPAWRGGWWFVSAELCGHTDTHPLYMS